MGNGEILQAIRRKILGSEYWRVRLFSNIRGYSFSDLKLIAAKITNTDMGAQAKIEHLKVCSLSFPYLVYGRPILTNSAKEKDILEEFRRIAEREGGKENKTRKG